MEVFNPNSNIDFLGWRKVSLTISLVLIVISTLLYRQIKKVQIL